MKQCLDSAETIYHKGKRFFIRLKGSDENNPVVLFLHGAAAVRTERK